MAPRSIIPTPSAYNYQLLIKHLLRTPLLYASEQEIVYRDRWRYTYAEFGRRVARLAGSLAALGVGQGDTVAIMDWDSHRYLECFFAVPMMGAVLHTVNVRLSTEQLVYTINHAEDDIILVNEEFAPLLATVRDQLATVKKIILLTDQEVQPQTDLMVDGEYEAMLAGAGDTYDFPDFSENTMATTFYTTGTTGLPKGVFFSHRQLVLHTYGLLPTLSAMHETAMVDSRDVYMPMTPMFHVHAWGMPYVATLLGLKQVYPGRYEPETLLRLVGSEKVTFSHCVPTILNMLLASPAVDTVDLNGWKVIIGGSALSAGLCKAALRRGVNVFTGYGMSETCPILSISCFKPRMQDLDEETGVKIRCRTGLPISNVLLEIVDGEGRPLPHDGLVTGEIVARTPWLTQGYLKDQEKSEDLWENGWLHTGDIGFIDKEGYLQVTDRLKDVIKTGGEWISSLTLEDIISRHPAVREAAVIGVPDEKWGERPLALVVLKDQDDPISEDELKKIFIEYAERGVIPRYGIPDRVVITDSIAKTSVGKLNKKELRKQYK
jgi:fatty-acyl-CoA synthase